MIESMPANPSIVGSFVIEHYQATTLDARFAIYEQYLNQLGFDGATVSYVPQLLIESNSLLTPVFKQTHEYPAHFLQDYASEQWGERDFTIRKVRQRQSGVMDWQEHERNGWLSADESHLILTAREEYKMRNGISVPVFYSHGVVAASVISGGSDADFKLLKKCHINTLLQCTQVFYEANFSQKQCVDPFILPLISQLKPKELQVLKYIAQGYPFKQVEDATGITRGYASNVLDKLRHRLGGLTRDRLMYLVGLVNLLDYTDI